MICPPVETLSDLLDNALPLKMHWQIRRHARRCPSCTRQLTAEANLRKQIASIAAGATAPEGLRARVFDAAGQTQVVSRRRSPVLLAASFCGVLAVAALWLLRPVVAPLPAFAQVAEAMRAVRTVRWQEELTDYDVAAKKVSRFVVTHSARLDPPVLSTAYPPEPRRSLLTPADIKVEQKAGLRVFTAPGSGFFSLEKNASATPSSVLREYILDRITAPRSRGGGSAAWESHKETVDGREFLRFESKIGGKQATGEAVSGAGTPRLTVPGYRYRIWADPDSLRVVRSETEYYDGQKHSRTTCTDFQYDLTFNNP